MPKSRACDKRRRTRRRKLDAGWTREMAALLFEVQPACVVCDSTANLHVDHVLPAARGWGKFPGNAVRLCSSCNARKGSRSMKRLPQSLKDLDAARKITNAALAFREAWESRPAAGPVETAATPKRRRRPRRGPYRPCATREFLHNVGA